MLLLIAALVALETASAGPAIPQTADVDAAKATTAVDAAASPLQKPLTKKGERYLRNLTFTGETEECISTWDGGQRMRVKRVTGLGDFHILYEMDDEEYFINEIPGERGCKGAGAPGYVSIAVDSRGRNPRGGICAGDRANVYRNSAANSVMGPYCEIGVFHRLVRNSDWGKKAD